MSSEQLKMKLKMKREAMRLSRGITGAMNSKSVHKKLPKNMAEKVRLATFTGELNQCKSHYLDVTLSNQLLNEGLNFTIVNEGKGLSF